MAVKKYVMESTFSIKLRWSLFLVKLQDFAINGGQGAVMEYAFSLRLRESCDGIFI